MQPFAAKANWVADGGLATELEKKGSDLNHPLWSARVLKDNPDHIFETHLEYLRAGAEILTTASYQASLAGFLQYGMYAREARETIFSSVMLACLARDKYYAEQAAAGVTAKRPILVAASCGPYGAYLADRSEYTGAYLPEKFARLGEYYEPKIEALISPRKNFFTDFLLLETMPSASEVKFVLGLLKRYASARVVVSFSRVDAAREARAFLDKDPQVIGWGFNCLSAEAIDQAVGGIFASAPPVKPLWLAPNRLPGTGTIAWAKHLKTWRALGSTVIGGCCGTNPADVVAISSLSS